MFPNVVNSNQAPAVLGDFASTNPFASVLAGPGALVAPKGGLIVGNFAWVGPQGQVSQSYVAGYQVGFLGRNNQALITEFLGEYTLRVPEGFMVTLFNEGDFWAKFAAGATVGNNVYADPNDGAPLAGASAPTLGTGTATAGATVSSADLASGTPTLTVHTVTNGIITPGDAVTGTGIPANTHILSQTSGTPGKAGVYVMSANASSDETAEAVVVTSNKILVTAVADGSFNFGDVFTGTGVPAGTSIVGQALPFKGVATISGTTVLTVTSVAAGSDLLRVGATVIGVGIPAGTTISAQTSGTPGGLGAYTLSAASTNAAGVAISSGDTAGGTGFYQTSSGAPFAAGTNSAPTTITVAGTAQATGFVVRGTYSPAANELGKISTR